jgi:Holliday junction resolvase
MNVNRKVGTGFERDLCLSLSGCGFWAHNLAQNSQGQPFDVIAARNGVSYPIDCKDCSKNIFKMERIEENQYSAMSLWKSTNNGESWFALRLNDGAVYMISFSDMEVNMLTKTALSEREIKTLGVSLEEWVKQCE